MSENFGSTTLAQVAIVVHNIEEAVQRYSDIFGLPVSGPIVTGPGLEANQTYRGAPSDARAKLAFISVGQVQIELIEPLGGDSIWQEVLDRKGECVHHIGFWVEGMQKSVDFLRSRGIPMVQRGDMGEGQYAYFESEPQLGVMLELLEQVRAARATP